MIQIEIFETRYNRNKLRNIIYVNIVWVGFSYNNKDENKRDIIILRWSRYDIWSEYKIAALQATVKKHNKILEFIKHTKFWIIMCNSTN